MFLHESTRRRLCRTGFWALCIAPTLLVAGWIVSVRSDRFRQAHEQAISVQTGLKANLAKVTCPRPGHTLYEGLELADAETGELLLSIRILEVADDGESLSLTCSQPEIHGGRLDSCGQVLLRQLRSDNLPKALHISAGELTLHGPGGARTFTDVEARLESAATGPQAAVSFRLAGSPVAEPAKFRVLRNRQTTPPCTGFELHTGGYELPTSLLAGIWPGVAEIGSGSHFRGSLWVTENPLGSDAELTGKLSGIDLDAIVTDRFPHKLSGQAELTIEKARFRQGRLEEAAGSLAAGPGLVGRSLVTALAQTMEFSAGQAPPTLASALPYNQLALAFAVDSRGIMLHGQCRQAAAGAVFIHQQTTLLSEPPQRPQPVIQLVHALAPQNEYQVPATRETDRLIQVLPIPPLVRPVGSEPAVPVARLKLRKPGQK